MCPPSFSNMSSSSCMSDVFRNYRLSTADKSQVCDGRNLDDLRVHLSTKPSKNSTAEDIKPKKKGTRKTDYSYRPTSSRIDRSKAEQRTTTQPQQPQPAKPK